MTDTRVELKFRQSADSARAWTHATGRGAPWVISARTVCPQEAFWDFVGAVYHSQNVCGGVLVHLMGGTWGP